LRHEPEADGIAYVFLGQEFVGRSKDRAFMCEDVADYERMARWPSFTHGLKRVVEGAANFRIALMCFEQDPVDCHRSLLVGRELAARGHAIKYILSDGAQKSQAEIEADLLSMAGHNHREGLFCLIRRARPAEAYRHRDRRVAYAKSGSMPDPNGIAAEWSPWLSPK
jgi:hypothetical protein